MKRIVTMEIAGKEYPMSFSLMASKKIAERYNGKVEEVLEKCMNVDGMSVKSIEVLTEILELLIAQGCAYKNMFEQDVPTKKTDPIIDGKWTPIPKEAIEVAIEFGDIPEAFDRIIECISKGQKKEIIVEEKDKKGKNVEAGAE